MTMSEPIQSVDPKSFFKYFSELKDCSPVAVVTGSVSTICNKTDRDGYAPSSAAILQVHFTTLSGLSTVVGYRCHSPL